MLPSTLRTVSASAAYPFRGSIAYPTQSLCTLRRGRHLPQRNTRYQAGATPYLDRSSTGWTAPASPGAHVTERRERVDGERQSVLALGAAVVLREHSGEAIGSRLGSIPR